MSNYRSRCNYITDTWTTTEHLSGCNEPTCPGCRPCEHDHCELRGCANHTDRAVGIWTCPSCIGRTRRDLATIKHAHNLEIPAEAQESGSVTSEAVNLNGPAAIVCDFPKTGAVDHTLTVIGGWDIALREIYGPETRLRVTVDRAVDFLDNLLNGQFAHSDQFEEFAKEIAACRSHLESVLHDSRRPETGAKCPSCDEDKPRLIRRYADNATDDSRDTWHCPHDPAHWWTHHDYIESVDVTDRESVKDGIWLTANEIAEYYGVKAATVRKWASRGQVKSRWIAESLRYDTQELKSLAEQEQTG